jgi:hypothetical protein
MALIVTVMSMAVFGVGTAHATDPVVKCQEQKLKARGKLELCLNKNAAKVLGGKPDAAAACQTTFSDALTKAGTACRYLDNGDGTVTDLNTGLQWEKKDDGGGLHDKDNEYNWPDAMSTFVSDVNGETDMTNPQVPGLGGHNDWRLPSIDELQTIVDTGTAGCGFGSGCIDPIFGPPVISAAWSSSTQAINSANAWYTNFKDGSVGGVDKAGALANVRAVRNAP